MFKVSIVFAVVIITKRGKKWSESRYGEERMRGQRGTFWMLPEISRLQGSYFWVSKGVEVCFLRYPLHEFSRSKYYFPFIFRVSFHGKSLGGPTLWVFFHSSAGIDSSLNADNSESWHPFDKLIYPLAWNWSLLLCPSFSLDRIQDQDDKDNNNKYEEKDNIISRYLLFLCVQIAALSPADINYEETLSTLRFGELLFFVSSNRFPSFSY